MTQPSMGSQGGAVDSVGPVKREGSYKSPPSSASDNSQHDGEDSRGRRQDRERSMTAKADDESPDGKERGTGQSNGKARKRKRSRKGLDKNFPCPEKGCGKSYSRAEHLYRHQLNHTPKKIYTCDFPSCNRQFVRQDLCTRHRERHTARGSHLQRKDPPSHDLDGRPISGSPIAGYYESPTSQFRPLADVNGGGLPRVGQTTLPSFNSPMGAISMAGRIPEPQQRSHSSTSLNTHIRSPTMYQSPTAGYTSATSLNRSNSDESHYSNAMYKSYDSSTPARSAPTSNYDMNYRTSSSDQFDSRSHHSSHTDIYPSRSNSYTLNGSQTWGTSANGSHSTTTSQTYNGQFPGQSGAASSSYISNQNLPSHASSLPPPLFPSATSTTSRPSHMGMSASASTPTATENAAGMGNSQVQNFDISMSTVPYAGSAYPPDGQSRSPYATADDFTAWLFSDPNLHTLPNDLLPGALFPGTTPYLGDPKAMSGIQYGDDDTPLNAQYVHALPPEHPMAVNSILDAGQYPTILSEEKRMQLLDLITHRFNEIEHAPVRKQKHSLLDGDRDDESHVLSLKMMKTYIGSYWSHFHPQMPILHKPTFSADRTPNLLLIAVIAVGASCLEPVHGHKLTQQGAELSNFLAWHLRGEIFKEKDFTPPAKLWVFQALLLLEVYEKMYSTRILHERAHVFHGTTLTLIRRGSSLIGRSPLDSPPMSKEESRSINTNGEQQESASGTPDRWWNHWITNEATRRTAFAAFIIDSLHATMFGHGITMVAHEMKLQLPCDESLWSATSSGDVSRIEANLAACGIKPITFFEGLKLTLTGKSVRTNSFGRTALMAGLLNVTWHMNQRDVQVRTLGASQALGGRARWRSALTKAFDFWKNDFEQSSEKGSGTTPGLYQLPARLDEENIFESKTVLHHLAHMAMHVDVVSCQIFANAKRLLGRTTLPTDVSRAQTRIREHWAPKASARDATFYSLKFLQKVLLQEPMNYSKETSGYSARDDFLLNRPWVLYFAALIVWAYGYALDGSIKSPPELSTVEQQLYDMRHYLTRVGGIEAPDDLANLQDRNQCMGLLYVLRDMFKKCRWELLHEAGDLLNNCIEMLRTTS